MPTLETLSQADLHSSLSRTVLRRAKKLVGRVQNPTRSGQTLTAQVRGTRLYDVEIDVKPSGIAAFCTCPYDWGGYCKHIGAVLLKWMQSPSVFRTTASPTAAAEPPAFQVIPVEPPATQRPSDLPFWIEATPQDWRQADAEQLGQWLGNVNMRDLRALAKKRGWKVRGSRKAELVDQLVPRLTDPAQVLTAFHGLDDEHTWVLRALALVGNDATVRPESVEQTARLWGRLAAFKQIETYTRHLCQNGLAMPGDAIDGYGRHYDFIPSAIARHLPPVLQDCLGSADDLLARTPADQLDLADPFALTRSVGQVLTLLEKTSPPLRPPMSRPAIEKFYPVLQGWDYIPAELIDAENARKLSHYSDLTLTVPPPAYSLPDDAIDRLAPVVGGADRLEFIYAVLVASSLLQPGSPVTVWPKVKIAFLQRNELTQWAILSRAFFYALNWSALWQVLRDPSSPLALKRSIRHQHLSPQDLSLHLYSFRSLVLGVLSMVPDGQWIVLDDLFAVLQAVWPSFDETVWQTYRYSGYRPGWFLAIKGSDEPLKAGDARHWAMAQGNYVRALISGPLHWLGLADLCWHNGQLAATRFHGLSDLYWNRVEAPHAPRHAARRVAADPPADAIQTDHHTIVVRPASVSGQTHGFLDQIAHLDTATPERFVYRLDAQATYESFERGATLAGLLREWDACVPIPMPETIQSQLDDWWAAYGRVRVYENLTVVELSDDYGLAELRAVSSLDQYLIAEISPRMVIIDPDGLGPLKAELEKAGYTPKVTEHE